MPNEPIARPDGHAPPTRVGAFKLGAVLGGLGLAAGLMALVPSIALTAPVLRPGLDFLPRTAGPGMLLGALTLGGAAFAYGRWTMGPRAVRRMAGILSVVLGGVSLALGALSWLYFWAMTTPTVVVGRPVRRRRRVVTAPVALGGTWCGEVGPFAHGLRGPDRGRAACWLAVAQSEHASIAAFSHLSLALQAVGGPPRLLGWIHRAASEEVQHAELCFTLASAYDGRRYGPSAWLAIPDAHAGWPRSIQGRLRRLAIESLLDGAIGEGWASAVASSAAKMADDPVDRQVLEKIAREEADHAELGWAIVAWCLDVGPREVATELRRALQGAKAPRIARQSPAMMEAQSSGFGDREEQARLWLTIHAAASDRLEGLLATEKAG